MVNRSQSINYVTHLGKGDLPKGDVTRQVYLVKWVTRMREGSKISKNWFCHL